jgi:hypothetical protein
MKRVLCKFEMANSKPVLSFASIVQGRDSSVRVTEDGLGDVVDVIMVVTGKDCNQANEVLRRMDHALFDKAICVIRNGRRYATLRDIITLIMVLPGKMAKELRSQFAEIIENYIRENLCSGENAANNDDPVMVGFKRRREELELFKLEWEIKAMTRTHLTNLKSDLEGLDGSLDERTRLMFKDSFMNLLMAPSGSRLQAQLADGVSPSANAPISISSVAVSLGYKPTTNESKRIGQDLRKRYIKQHGKPPPKHDQLCDGRVTLVNSYSEQDRPLVEEALHAYFKSESDGEDSD